MTDRYDRGGHGARDTYEAAVKQAPSSRDDYYDDYHDTAATGQAAYSYEDEQYEEGPEWTYDEKREIWVDRYGNPYVEGYAEGEEDRYAPAEGEYLAPQAEARLPQRRSRGGAVSIAALVLVASIGGGLAYAWKKGGFVGSDLPGIGSAPPVIKASTDPVKIKPAETTVANDQPTREIFDRSNQAAPANERLVRHEEQPVAIVPVRPEGGGPAVANGAPDATRPVATSNITLPPTDTPPPADQTVAAGGVADLSPGEAPGGPRQVRTIKVMPDNSVVTGEAPITAPQPAPPADVANAAPDTPPAGAAQAPVTSTATTQPVVPSQQTPSADLPPQPPQPSTVTSVTTVPADPTASAPPVSNATSDDDSATTVVEPAPQAEAEPPAIPPVRPRNIPTTTQVASAEPTAPAPASNGAYVVQVSSQKSPAEAQAAFQSLQRKYPSVLGGMKASIRKVDLPERGTYYRVRVGSWGSSTEAAAFCAKLKAAGGDCVIARN
ncbi:SPOR domain-containing protein [Labrys miyagiensis]